MRRREKEIVDRNRIDRILRTEPVLHLGIPDDRAPYVLPISFAWDGTDLLVHSALEGRKIDLLRRNPRVGFEVVRVGEILAGSRACGFSVRYECVIGEGTAEFLDDREEKRIALLLMMVKYSGREDWELPDAAIDGTAVIRVHVDRLSAKESPAGER